MVMVAAAAAAAAAVWCDLHRPTCNEPNHHVLPPSYQWDVNGNLHNCESTFHFDHFNWLNCYQNVSANANVSEYVFLRTPPPSLNCSYLCSSIPSFFLSLLSFVTVKDYQTNLLPTKKRGRTKEKRKRKEKIITTNKSKVQRQRWDSSFLINILIVSQHGNGLTRDHLYLLIKSFEFLFRLQLTIRYTFGTLTKEKKYVNLIRICKLHNFILHFGIRRIDCSKMHKHTHIHIHNFSCGLGR